MVSLKNSATIHIVNLYKVVSQLKSTNYKIKFENKFVKFKIQNLLFLDILKVHDLFWNFRNN